MSGRDERDPAVRPAGPSPRRGPGAPGAIALAVVAALALFAIAPLTTGGGADPAEPTTTTIVGLDPFDLELQSTSSTTTTSTPLSGEVSPDPGPDAFGWDETTVARIEAMFEWVGDFWAAVGGRGDPAVFIDGRAADLGLDGMVGFLAAFQSGLVASDCRVLGSNGVECSVTAHDPAIRMVGITGPTARLVVGMGGSGIEYVETPPLLSSASLTLSSFAREAYPGEFAELCEPEPNPAPAPPLRIGTLAAVPECGEFLAGLVREYLIG